MAITPRFTRTAAIVAVGAVSAFGLAACSSGDSGDSGASGEPITIEYLHRLPDGEGMTPPPRSSTAGTPNTPTSR